VKAYVDWRCPECGLESQSQEYMRPGVGGARMHPCPKLRGLNVPMVRKEASARIVLHEREDYVGREAVQLDPERGRPVMSLETQHSDGHTDLIVYAPAATSSARRT